MYFSLGTKRATRPQRRPGWYWSPVLLVVILLATGSAGATDRLARMARSLISGSGILDYDLAADRFSRINDPRVLGVLLKLTDSENTVARAAAAGVLWRYNDVSVRKKLVSLLRDAAEAVRIEAAKSLCLMGYTANLSVVAAALASPQQNSRIRSLKALAQINTDESRQAVQKFKSGPVPTVRLWQAYARYRLGVKKQAQLKLLSRPLLQPLQSPGLAGVRDPSPQDLRRLARRYTRNKPLRRQAALALALAGDEEALQLLARATADPSSSGDPLGPAALLRFKPDLAARSLSNCLAEQSPWLRLGCARAAGLVRPVAPAARQALAAALARTIADPARLVRQAAARAAINVYDASIRQALLAALQHQDLQTRRSVARALSRVADAETTTGLLAALSTENDADIKRLLYQALNRIGSPRAVTPLLGRLKKLVAASNHDLRVSAEIPLCVAALGGSGELAARGALAAMKGAPDNWRQVLVEVLAHTGSRGGLDFFLNRMREEPPDPEGPEVRFFDSLPTEMTATLEEAIHRESALWIRLVLARTLFKLGRDEYARGLRWGLRQEDPYLRQLAAALCAGVKLPSAVPLLGKLLEDKQRTAGLAARALLADGSPEALQTLLQGLPTSTLRRRPRWPLLPFWEGERRADHPYAKEVDNERVWILFADDRLGRRADLFLTWSMDGRVWHQPAFTGLTSFVDPEGNVPPPTFSLRVRGRDITIALTRTFARSANPQQPRFQTIQRVHKYKLRQFFNDRDGDQSSDLEESALFTRPDRADSDGDGLADGKDKNPLSRPAAGDSDRDIVKLLAFGRLAQVDKPFVLPERMLVVRGEGAARGHVPELPLFAGLVLQLTPGQLHRLWQGTGAGYPHLVFEPTRLEADRNRAEQVIRVVHAPGDESDFRVQLARRQQQWVVTGTEF